MSWLGWTMNQHKKNPHNPGGSESELIHEVKSLKTTLSGLTTKISGERVVSEVLSGAYLASGIWVQTTAVGGGQVSGAVIISGDIRSVLSGLVAVASGAYLASGLQVITTVDISGTIVRAEQYGTWAQQVSGAVIVSGDIRSVLSGLMDISDRAARLLGVAKVSGEMVSLPSTQPVKVSGEIVSLPSTQLVKVSGETLISKVSGEVVSLPSTQPVKVSGEVVSLPVTQIVKVSGETLIGKISGETLIGKVSGEVLDLKLATEVKTWLVNPYPALSGGAVLHSGSTRGVVVKGWKDNSGDCYLGGIVNRPYSGFGFALEPSEMVALTLDDFGRVFVFATVSGDKATFLGVA